MKITMTCHNNQNTCGYFGDSFYLKKSKKKKKKKQFRGITNQLIITKISDQSNE